MTLLTALLCSYLLIAVLSFSIFAIASRADRRRSRILVAGSDRSALPVANVHIATAWRRRKGTN